MEEITESNPYFKDSAKVKEKKEYRDEYKNYLDLIKKLSIVSGSRFRSIEKCVRHGLWDLKVYETGERKVTNYSCHIDKFCPRCNIRDRYNCAGRVVDKFWRFRSDFVKGWTLTVPEGMREIGSDCLFKYAREALKECYGYLVGGVMIIHEYSTKNPTIRNPHAEAYFVNYGIGYDGNRIELGSREKKEKLIEMRNIWQDILGSEKRVNVWYECINDFDEFYEHTLPYALKLPLRPDWIKSVDEDSITYFNSEEVIALSISDVKHLIFDGYDYYKPSKQRVHWFGFLGNRVYPDYYKKLFGEDYPKPEKDIERGKFDDCKLSVVFTNTDWLSKAYRRKHVPVKFNPNWDRDDLERLKQSDKLEYGRW